MAPAICGSSPCPRTLARSVDIRSTRWKPRVRVYKIGGLERELVEIYESIINLKSLSPQSEEAKGPLASPGSFSLNAPDQFPTSQMC